MNYGLVSLGVNKGGQMGYVESGYIDQHEDESFRALHIDCHIPETGHINQIPIRHTATIAGKILVTVDMQTGIAFSSQGNCKNRNPIV